VVAKGLQGGAFTFSLKLKYQPYKFLSICVGCAWDAQPISRSRRTSIKKTIIYRLVVDPVALLVTYVLTGELSGSIIAVLLIEAFSTAFYYILDRLM